jgi:glutamyl/glutaminyl-tRNA synthetase
LQSQRMEFYRSIFQNIRNSGALYPCVCSRQDVIRSLSAPHVGEEEPLYPGSCRTLEISEIPKHKKVSWRFRVPDGEIISFSDGNLGRQKFVAGKDFGDFVVWRHDEIPSYQLAVVADDAAMQITEVVRGADLLVSTARQILLYRVLKMREPKFFHCPLMTDQSGARLAKRHDSLSLRTLRRSGIKPEALRESWNKNCPLSSENHQ